MTGRSTKLITLASAANTAGACWIVLSIVVTEPANGRVACAAISAVLLLLLAVINTTLGLAIGSEKFASLEDELVVTQTWLGEEMAARAREEVAKE
jgi:hypothetical protein